MIDEGKSNSFKAVGALQSGIRILDYVGQRAEGVGVTQVARDLKLNPSTCFNLLKTLASERLVDFDPIDKTYRLGFGFVAIARERIENDGLTYLVEPHLEHLARQHDVTATLWRRLGRDRLVLVARAEGGGMMQVHMKLGRKLPLYVAALGRCMAAYIRPSQDDLRARFDELRWQSSPTFEEYVEQVREAAERGYALDIGNFWRGVTAIASPILGSNGQPLAAISVVDFSQQLADKLDLVACDVSDRARMVSEQLSKTSPRNASRSNR